MSQHRSIEAFGSGQHGIAALKGDQGKRGIVASDDLLVIEVAEGVVIDLSDPAMAVLSVDGIRFEIDFIRWIVDMAKAGTTLRLSVEGGRLTLDILGGSRGVD